ncbi:hypothetical protein D3C78_450960 [compost metagenome]
MGATADVLHDAVHLLRAMADADGEHQERYQHGERVERIAEQHHQAELPDHRDHRAAQHQQGAADATGIGVDDADRDDHGDQEEHHDLFQAGDQVTDQLGEADHIDVDLGVGTRGVALADLLDRARQRLVVDRLAFGVDAHQRHDDHAGAVVVGD